MVKKDPEICRKIRDRVDKWEKYWTINRSLYYEWIDFVLGDQWREDESKLFERYNKIPLMMNKLGVLANHMAGDQIQNTTNLQISPDDDVPVQDATVRAALVKNISLNSDAKSIYQKAYSQSIIGGYSAFALGTKYLHKRSLDQEIIEFGFDDPNSCYWDMSAKHVCKVDGMYAGYKTRVSRKWFRDKYGKDIESQIGSTAITEDSTVAFADNDEITIVDDFEKEGKKIKLYKLSDDSVVTSKQFAKLEKVIIDDKKIAIKNGQPVTILQEREEIDYKIIHRQIAGDFIIDETVFPCVEGDILPVIFVDQKSYFTKQGQQITRSFFKDVKDAQRYLNYLATQSAYMMKISRYDQFIMPRKCAASPDAQQQWRDPSVVNGALYYDETPSGAKPEQLRPPELSQSLMTQYERTLMDIQTGTGIYNTQLGENGNEISGEAIARRNERGNKNTQIPRTALDIAIATSGELINDMIPKVYDTRRTVILPMPESSEERIVINNPVDEYGLQIENNMREGRYKIRLKPGASYEGQKQEALQSLQLVLNADRSGNVFPMIADLYAENLPLDNNLEIRNRLRTLVPKEIVEAGKTGKPLPQKSEKPTPDQIMAQLKQAELQQKAQDAERNYQLKMMELQHKEKEMQRKAIETHQDMTMAFEKLEAEKEEAAARLQETLLKYQAETNRTQADIEIANANNLIKILTHKQKQTEARM
jgi:hypothetical protein